MLFYERKKRDRQSIRLSGAGPCACHNSGQPQGVAPTSNGVGQRKRPYLGAIRDTIPISLKAETGTPWLICEIGSCPPIQCNIYHRTITHIVSLIKKCNCIYGGRL